MKKLLLTILLIFFSCEKTVIDLKIIDASDIQGQINSHENSEAVLVNFWATNCGPCVEEFPMIVELSKKYSELGMKVYFVSADWEDQKKEVEEFLVDQGVSGVSFLKEEGGDNEFINDINKDWSGAIPYTIVYNRKGDLTGAWEGKKDKNYFEKEIKKALSI